MAVKKPNASPLTFTEALFSKATLECLLKQIATFSTRQGRFKLNVGMLLWLEMVDKHDA